MVSPNSAMADRYVAIVLDPDVHIIRWIAGSKHQTWLHASALRSPTISSHRSLPFLLLLQSFCLHPFSIFFGLLAPRWRETMANSASGMAVNDECKLMFLELKTKRNYRFIIFKIDERIQQVTVEKLGQPEETYDDFTASLPADECRYAVFDFDFVTDENCQKSKIFFISWAPDTSRVRSKMLYASSKDRFKRELDGIQVELQATDPSEISIDIVKGRAL
ncbi:hypothetical protein C4D60_Mb11t03670 [Musa balbisiana]|uniref:ADF-H domain-containing protein n=1 Tax=Musa balbisiana TaxID=52838 RepID=A0A4S8J1I2_MUSBA|nr:hypothetical protein C4D60_Mb11t03670 [Musa balbisiana]